MQDINRNIFFDEVDQILKADIDSNKVQTATFTDLVNVANENLADCIVLFKSRSIQNIIEADNKAGNKFDYNYLYDTLKVISSEAKSLMGLLFINVPKEYRR